MTAQRILILLFTTFVLNEGKSGVQNIEILGQNRTTICSSIYNNTNKVQCYCTKDRSGDLYRSADCYLSVEDTKSDDPSWDGFYLLKDAHKLSLTNNRGLSLMYIPTKALMYTTALKDLDVKYGNIETVKAYAFANLSSLEKITLRNSQIKILEANAFAHLKDLSTINLDKNNIVEINRDVFIDLPSIRNLFLTSNTITIIHDRAFVHLVSLLELEINMNSLFSLNSETFSGMRKLQNLDLSHNNLEVIGDNTFLPLVELRSLNLEENKIQMLDEKAFHGLFKLQSLSLAHNKLKSIDNSKIFEGLTALNSFSLRSNNMTELKVEVMSPILRNFYVSDSSMDVEDNNFTCDCRLEWLASLKNRTKSKIIRLALDNLKCYPDSKVREMVARLDEAEKNSGKGIEDEEPNGDYEYYDDSQLNGSLFYTDLRDLLNCTTIRHVHKKTIASATEATAMKVIKTTANGEKMITKATSPTLKITIPKTPVDSAQLEPKTINKGLLNLEALDKHNEAVNKDSNMEFKREKKPDSYTTSRLATVSAKPIKFNGVYEDGMASDEAKPDKLKGHRDIQDEYKTPRANKSSGNTGSALLISMTLYFILRY